MNNTPIPIDINSISSKKDFLKLAEEVNKTKTPRILKKNDKAIAVLMPAGVTGKPESDIFTELSQNEIFIKEAEAAKKQLVENPTQFTNLTEKFSHLIKPRK